MACERQRGKVWCALFFQLWPWESTFISGLLLTCTTAPRPSCLLSPPWPTCWNFSPAQIALIHTLTHACAHAHTHVHTHTHASLEGKWGISTRCAHAPWDGCVGMLACLSSPHNTAAPFLQSGHLWLGDSEVVLSIWLSHLLNCLAEFCPQLTVEKH